jgi:RNA polymerase sigma-70 factor (ECF subfamily)
MLVICNRILRDEGAAQEALQDVYLAVWQKAGTIDETKASPTTWLAAITRNRAIDHLRRRQQSTLDLSEAAKVPDERSSALDMLIAEQEQTRLKGCINQLDARPKRLIYAAFFSGTTYLELAREEAVPVGTMKSWLRRSLARLRTDMLQSHLR